MTTRRWLASAALLAVPLAGCGSSANSKTTASTSSASSKTSSEPAALSGVKGRVLNAGELVGFEPSGGRTLGISAASWTEEEGVPERERASETKRLTGLGFVAAISERLQPSGGGNAEGLSVVEQFKSPGSARTELAYQVEHDITSGVKTFAVSGIPGATGFGGTSSQSTGMNVAFSKGAYYYLVGTGWPTGTSGTPTRAQLIAAARSLYDRVKA